VDFKFSTPSSHFPRNMGYEVLFGDGAEKLLCFTQAHTGKLPTAVPKWRVFDAVGGSVNGSRNS